jgi:hypothetical protein
LDFFFLKGFDFARGVFNEALGDVVVSLFGCIGLSALK